MTGRDEAKKFRYKEDGARKTGTSASTKKGPQKTKPGQAKGRGPLEKTQNYAPSVFKAAIS